MAALPEGSRYAPPMERPSYWQLEAPSPAFPALRGRASADVCVIGAGVTGASCAWRLLEHGLSVLLVEAREVAGGASGRNGGFASTGTALGHHEVAERLGDDAAVSVQEATDGALDEMERLARELGVSRSVRRTGSLWLASHSEAQDVDAFLAAAGRGNLRAVRADERIPERLRGRFVAAVEVPQDGELQPALFVRALAAGVAARGGDVREHSSVRSLSEDGDGWRVVSDAGTVGAQAVVVTGDGLIPHLLPELGHAIYPVRGQMLVTAPLPPDDRVVQMPSHSHFGYLYYRPTMDGRLALGGGRQADLEAEYTEVEETSEPVQAALDRFLRQTLGLSDAPVEHRWAGIMGFSADLLPLAGPVPERPGLYVSGGYSGVGNVQGFMCGRLVADLIAVGSHPLSAVYDPARMPPDAPAEPLERMRNRELGAALLEPA
jgi:gamma-glutamylputrescine oxidase